MVAMLNERRQGETDVARVFRSFSAAVIYTSMGCKGAIVNIWEKRGHDGRRRSLIEAPYMSRRLIASSSVRNGGPNC